MPSNPSDAEKYEKFLLDVRALRRAGHKFNQRLAEETFMRDTLKIEPIKVDPKKRAN